MAMDVTKCPPGLDWGMTLVTIFNIVGPLIGNAPQQYRIIKLKTSEGLNALSLLLGSTSCAGALWNMVAMQWGIVKCCQYVGFGKCVALTSGVAQVFTAWLCYTVIFALYIMYYPELLKYPKYDVEELSHDARVNNPKGFHSSEWRLSVLYARITFVHFIACATVTFIVVGTADPPLAPGMDFPKQVQSWATFLGVTSAFLAAIQTAPQLLQTYRQKTVGVLSIPTLCIQTFGMMTSTLGIALRPGTNWTSWLNSFISGVMLGSLLLMCLAWRVRQKRLGIDDFGKPAIALGVVSSRQPSEALVVESDDESGDEGDVLNERAPFFSVV